MASRYRPVKDEAEMLAMYRAGLLMLNRANSRTGQEDWESCRGWPDEESMVDRYKRACTGESLWLPQEFAVLVEEEDDDDAC